MKKIINFFVAISLLGAWACKKEQPQPKSFFGGITYADIQKLEPQFNQDELAVSDASNPEILKAGSIILYKTNLGALGALKIVDISAQNLLTIDLVNFGANGSPKSKKGIRVEGTWQIDLDAGVQTDDYLLGDVRWNIFSAENKAFKPLNTSKFYLYSK